MNIDKLAVEKEEQEEENDPNLIVWDGEEEGEGEGEEVNVNRGNWEALLLNAENAMEEEVEEELEEEEEEEEEREEVEEEQEEDGGEEEEEEEGRQHLLQSEDATPIGRPKRRRILSQAASESNIALQAPPDVAQLKRILWFFNLGRFFQSFLKIKGFSTLFYSI